MRDIYLHAAGQQTGPYQPDQLRQMVAEGKVTAGTIAWYQGLSEWTSVDNVLASLSTDGVPPIPSTPAKSPPAKKGMNGCLLAAIIGVCALLALFVFSCLAGIALGPITTGIKKAKENISLQTSRAIALAMFQYANDNQGAYPDGKTSTEVFQKLIDGNYVSDPAIFYIAGMPDKIRPSSKTLTAANVCYDVTSGVTSDSPDSVPVVFCTGYTITYSPGASAQPDATTSAPFPGLGGGMTVAYKNNAARFINASADGTVPAFIPADFSPGTKTYQQLRP